MTNILTPGHAMKFVPLPFDSFRCRPQPGPAGKCRVCARWADHPEQAWGNRTPLESADPNEPRCDFIPADELNRRIDMTNKLPPHPDHTMQWSPREQRVLVGYFETLQQRIAELEAQLVAWNQKAATWIASPEAAKRLEGYRELTARIAELEAQNTQLTASLETASSTVIMLKQQQREGWAQLASGQHLAQVTGFNVPVTFGGCPSCGRKDCVARACTRPAPAQKPLSASEVEQILGRWSYEIHGDRARYIVRETEAAHGIKEKP